MSKTPEQIYDELLVLKSQDGDHRAFAELVKRWQQRLWRHARQFSDNRDAAADILQEAWMDILRGLRDPASFPKWAYRIVSNKCVDWLRRQKRRRNLVNNAQEELPNGMDELSQTTVEDDVGRLRQGMRRLPADRRAMLSMFYVEEMLIAEIGAALAIPVGTVKSRLHYARNQLKTILERIGT
ncbi:MAG: RNA polymerase sigma factor [Planctomycetes bacterium]|nr:RNA polymerase sigma factor [Planctomycetota bacterium]